MARISRNGRRKVLKNPSMEGDTSNLPCDVIENILSRLPVKSLLRFKSVSKPWYNIISDTKFARFHLQQSKNLYNKTIFIPIRNGLRPHEFRFLNYTNQNFQLEALEFPLKKYREADVLCSCDGLVLLKNHRPSDKMFVIWNPSTRTYTKFSCPYLIPKNSRTFGLCYDVSNNDYKVVLVITDNRYAVFSYKKNSWTEKNGYSLASLWDPGLFVNGALHWVANKCRKDFDSNAIEGRRLQQLHKKCSDCRHSHYSNFPVNECNYDYAYEICCFDPKDDKFKKLSTPSCFDISSKFHLVDLGGHFCLYRNTYDYKMVEIWIMKEYGDCNSWTKFLTIENVPVLHTCWYVKLLCLTNENNIIMDIDGKDAVVYNPRENKFCKIHVYGDNYFNSTIFIKVTPLLCWNDSLLLPSRNQQD